MGKKEITIKDLFDSNIHAITFELLSRALGAKLFKNGGVEIRLNYEGMVKLVRPSMEELKELRDNINFLYEVVKQSELM